MLAVHQNAGAVGQDTHGMGGADNDGFVQGQSDNSGMAVGAGLLNDDARSAAHIGQEIIVGVGGDQNVAGFELLGGLGSSAADADIAQFDAGSMIKKVKVVFTPSKELMAAIKSGLEFENAGVVEAGFTFPSTKAYLEYKSTGQLPVPSTPTGGGGEEEGGGGSMG